MMRTKKSWYGYILLLILAGTSLEARNRKKASRGEEQPTQIIPVKAEQEVQRVAYTRHYRKNEKTKKTYANFGYAMSDMFTNAIWDVGNLFRYLFTWDTFKVVSTVFPAYVGARMIDERLQNWFYKSGWHKNINQMPNWCHDVAKFSIALPIVILGSDAFFAGDDDRRFTGQMMLLGLPFVIWTKTWVKKIEFNASFRPWNEYFSCEKRAYGGFPSGHMAQALYMAVLYGTRYGPQFAIPLGVIATFLGINFLTCNRHYASQLIAGGGFGALYALSASKVVDSRLAEKVKMGMTMDLHGRPSFSLAYSW